MDSLKAYELAKKAKAAGAQPMVFDWTRAAELIRERNGQRASAGLRDDWNWTGGCILADGKPVFEDYTYLASLWALPEIVIDGSEPIPCFRLQSESPGWGADTKWPAEALEILNQKEQ